MKTNQTGKAVRKQRVERVKARLLPKPFSETELKTIRIAAWDVWERIVYDAASSDGKSFVSRAEVIDRVLDVKRLDQELRLWIMPNGNSLADRFAALASTTQIRLLESMFPRERYPL